MWLVRASCCRCCCCSSCESFPGTPLSPPVAEEDPAAAAAAVVVTAALPARHLLFLELEVVGSSRGSLVLYRFVPAFANGEARGRSHTCNKIKIVMDLSVVDDGDADTDDDDAVVLIRQQPQQNRIMLILPAVRATRGILVCFFIVVVVAMYCTSVLLERRPAHSRSTQQR